MLQAIRSFARALRLRCPNGGGGPIVLYPISKLCWLAFDLLFRPPREEDFATPGGRASAAGRARPVTRY